MEHRTPRPLAIKELAVKANEIRKDVLEVAVRNGAGHIAPSLSCVDILTVLYYRIMKRSQDPQWEHRDRLVFSKAHGCYALYAILADIGYLERAAWENFYRDSFLAGCVERSVTHGLEAGCGSLGHGLPQAVGLAYGAKLQGLQWRVYCVLGDGELQEGSNWEALQFAVKHELSNLTVIVDANRLQAMDFLENILTVKGRKDDIQRKMKAFGCEVKSCDGHSLKAMNGILRSWLGRRETMHVPQVLAARTIKGYGMKCMENVPKFHFRLPTEGEMKEGNRYEQA
ncbi:MAG: transketolase [Pseudomonadota bacterium]|nr:transketolase [Pseudomonadota bacterium]